MLNCNASSYYLFCFEMCLLTYICLHVSSFLLEMEKQKEKKINRFPMQYLHTGYWSCHLANQQELIRQFCLFLPFHPLFGQCYILEFLLRTPHCHLPLFLMLFSMCFYVSLFMLPCEFNLKVFVVTLSYRK